MADLNKNLERVLNKLRAQIDELTRLMHSPGGADLTKLERVQREMEQTHAEQKRLLAELQIQQRAVTEEYVAYGNLAAQRPLREKVLDVLNEIKVPAQPRAVTEIADAIYGYVLPAARFASLRRDEERAFRKDASSRPAWIVPAINVYGLTAMPRFVVSSAWPAVDRLIGARTLRVDHLRVLVALLNVKERMDPGAEKKSNKKLDRLISHYSLSVPHATVLNAEIDSAQIRAAVERELIHVEAEDRQEKEKGAELLARLPEPFRTLGQPSMIDGGLEREASGR